MKKQLLFFFGGLVFGGQSIQLSTTTASNSLIPAQTAGHPWRVEFSIHNWSTTGWSGNARPLDGTAVGLDVQLLNLGAGDLRLQMYSRSATGGGICQIPGLGSSGPNGGGSIYGNLFLTVRFEEDPVALVDYCQAWDINGAQVLNQAFPYTSNPGTNSNGAYVGGLGPGTTFDTAYFRIYTSTVPANARPPVTADTMTSCLVFWKFDLGNNTGSLNDSCPAGPYNAAMSAGSPAYVATPGQTLVVPVLKTMNAPIWGNTASLRAGFPAQLDGTASYSQADGSAAVTCFWQILSGPTPAPTWDNNDHQTCTPTIRGLIFGDYKFELVTVDVANSQATASQDIGAVATDSNGVVVNADPNVDFLFGPMIAWGQNPWGYQDYWAEHASQLRLADYLNNGWVQGPLQKPQWEYTGQGTVSYYFNCVGPVATCNNSLGTALTAAYNPGNTTIAVANAAALDLTSLPTHVILYNGTSNELRICSASGNILTLCYDGADQAPLSFGNGTAVLQSKVSGSATRFLTDPVAAVCPLGAPGPPGPSAYSTGTVSLAPNSSTLTGVGTTWTSFMAGDYVRIPSTHGGVPFVFVAQITAFNSATNLTLNRVYPADADPAGGLAYNIMAANRTIVLRHPHATDATGMGEIMFGTSGCESETAVYLNPANARNSFASGHDVPPLDGLHVTGVPFSVTDTNGWVNESSTGGISFYGESLAHRALYYRSGLTSALTAANYISDYWIKSPWGNSDGNGYPRLFLGGEGIGAFVSGVLTGRVSWSDLRGYAFLGELMANGFASSGCNSWDDTRDSGYAYAWLILGAIFDPDMTSTNAPGGIPWRTYWQNQLAEMKANDTNCQNQTPSSNNSFANGFIWNANLPALTMTNGSAVATGTGIPSSMCNGTASGTAAVTTGSNAITILAGSVPGGTNDLFLTGTTGGGTNVFVQSIAYGSGVLGEYWMGDSGTVSWISGNFDGYPGDGEPQDMLVIATSGDDLGSMQKSWACIWNSSTSITLNRPWDGPSTDSTHVYHPYNGNLAGYGQQPFMLGIKSYGENLLATQTLPALSSFVAPYQAFTANSTSWIWNVGMDHQLLGTNYGRIFQQCEPGNTAPPGTSFGFRAPGCTYGNDPTAVYLSREQNSETGASHTIYYSNNPTGGNRLLGDQFYGALWGFCPWTTGGVFCDVNSTAANAASSNLSDGSIHAGKWTGFFTGVGMSHRWPAARLGGVQPAQPRPVLISLRMADVPAAASVKVIVTAPSSAQASVVCPTEPCTVTVDDRQGAHWYQLEYLSARGNVLSTGQPVLLATQ